MLHAGSIGHVTTSPACSTLNHSYTVLCKITACSTHHLLALYLAHALLACRGDLLLPVLTALANLQRQRRSIQCTQRCSF